MYGKKGETKGRITGKIKDWHSGISSSGSSYYSTIVTTDGGRSSGWSPDANLVRWGDIKDKIAFEHSEKKNEEDNEMERSALSRAT
jgi:hypothetical protein